MIFLDIVRIKDLPFELQVASILEEFVHVFMNVADEDVVMDVVCRLYDGVENRGGRYMVRAHP